MSYRDNGPLGGNTKRLVIRELALGRKTQSELATEYGVSRAAITAFKHRNQEAINELVKKHADDFADLLIADKRWRLASLEKIHEIAMTPQPKVTQSGKVAYDDEDNVIMEVQLGEARQALKQAAEELGQLANRMTLSGDINTTTTYRIVNVTDDDLT